MSAIQNIMTVIGQLLLGVRTEDAGGSRELVRGALGWTEDFLGLIAENQTLMLFCIAIPLVGLGIGIIRRLIKVRA